MLVDETEHPWQSARDEFELSVLPRLKKDGNAIGELARNGDVKAKRVIELYTQLHRSFDPMTLMLLQDAMRELHNAEITGRASGPR